MRIHVLNALELSRIHGTPTYSPLAYKLCIPSTFTLALLTGFHLRAASLIVLFQSRLDVLQLLMQYLRPQDLRLYVSQSEDANGWNSLQASRCLKMPQVYNKCL